MAIAVPKETAKIHDPKEKEWDTVWHLEFRPLFYRGFVSSGEEHN